MECNKYTKQRRQMRLDIKKGPLTAAKLLGDKKVIKHTMKFIKETGRMEQ